MNTFSRGSDATQERRKMPALRILVDSAPLRCRTVLISLLRRGHEAGFGNIEDIARKSLTPVSKLSESGLPGEKAVRRNIVQCLELCNINYVEELCGMAKVEFINRTRLGPIMTWELEEAMKTRGIYFKGEEPK